MIPILFSPYLHLPVQRSTFIRDTLSWPWLGGENGCRTGVVRVSLTGKVEPLSSDYSLNVTDRSSGL